MQFSVTQFSTQICLVHHASVPEIAFVTTYCPGADLYWPATEATPGSASPTSRLAGMWPARFGL